MSRGLKVFLAAALVGAILIGLVFSALLKAKGRDDITVCNDSGARVTFALALQAANDSMPVFETTPLDNGACVNTQVTVNVDMSFRIDVNGAVSEFGYLTTHLFTLRHSISIQAPDTIDYSFDG